MDKVKALSDLDIKNIMDNKINVVMYSDLHKYNNIKQLLGKYNRCIILYIFEELEGGGNSGHWVAVTKTPKNTISFFDSYGTIPDKTIMKLPPNIKSKFKEDYNYLSKLIYDSKLPIEYNNKTLQQHHSVVCGYYCILFCCCMDLNMEQFQKIFSNNKKKNDELVYNIVSPYLYL